MRFLLLQSFFAGFFLRLHTKAMIARKIYRAWWKTRPQHHCHLHAEGGIPVMRTIIPMSCWTKGIPAPLCFVIWEHPGWQLTDDLTVELVRNVANTDSQLPTALAEMMVWYGSFWRHSILHIYVCALPFRMSCMANRILFELTTNLRHFRYALCRIYYF